MNKMAEHEAGRSTHQHPPAPEAWVKTELARHPQRPYPMDFIQAIFTDFSEIHGDRAFGDDAAMACGMAFFHGEPVMVIGNPEGYRKALRCMQFAEKFNHPIFTFIDLAGANPGIGAEERGQGEAIARNLIEMARLRVPTIATVTGEGGSGGALALAVADRVLMLENSIYSVISPEGCASIMWKDAGKKQQAAAALRYTADDVLALQCVDDVLPEPEGGSQNDPGMAFAIVAEKLRHHLAELRSQPIDQLLEDRYRKFRNIAQFYTTA